MTLILFSPQLSLGWGVKGHQIVALIAQERLSPKAKEKIAAILGPGVGLGDIAVCADEIKRVPADCAGAFELPAMPESSPWHYVNVLVHESPREIYLKLQSSYYCNQGGSKNCVVDQIGEDLKVLKSRRAALIENQIALMFLVHFVGDIHQPLHSAAELAADADNDKGGLKKTVWLGRKTNLHAAWDSLVLAREELQGVDPESLAEELAGQITDEDAASWVNGDIALQSAYESTLLARNIIYPRYHRDAADGGRVVLGRDYQDEMSPIIRLRLKQAGARLAHLIEKALD